MYNKKNEVWKELSHAHLTSFPQITRAAAAKLIDQMSSEELNKYDKDGASAALGCCERQ